MMRTTWLFGVLLFVAAAVLRVPSSLADDPSRAVDDRIVMASNMVLIQTNQGNFKVKLYPEKAPKTVANFLSYVDARFYDDLVFHRVIPGFVIQGGGYDAKMTLKKVREPVKNESDNGLKHKRGTFALARAADPNSGQAQFYINLINNTGLDQLKYCVFGEVIEGMDVVDKIAKVPTGNNGPHQNVPVTPVVIHSIRRSSP